MQRRQLAFLLAFGVALHGQAVAGPVIIGGDDLDLHGSYNGTVNVNGWLYVQKAISRMTEQGCITRPGNDGCIAALGCALSTTTCCDAGAAIHYAGEVALGACVTYYEGATAINGFFTALASGSVNPAILYIPSCSHNGVGGVTVAEGEALTAHAADIKAFVNSGGGLMAHVDEAPETNGWLTTVLPGIVAHPNTCQITGAALTSAGVAAFPALSNADISSGPCHNTFTGNLNSLAVLATDGQNRNLILGGDCSTAIDENLPPVAQGFPPQNQITVCPGNCATLSTSFTPPEASQWASTNVNLMGLWNATVTYSQGNPSTQELLFCPSNSQIGDHVVRYTAIDNGTPQRTTTVDLTVHVVACPCSTTISNGSFTGGGFGWTVLTPGDVTFPSTGGNPGGYARFFSMTAGWAGLQIAFTTTGDPKLVRVRFQDYLEDFAPVAREVYAELDGQEIFRREPVQGWRNESAFGVASAGAHTLSIWARVHPSITTKVDNVEICLEPFCPTDPEFGLVAHYRCNGGATDGQELDSSGRSNNANVYIATPFLATGAQFGTGPLHGTSLHFLPTNGIQEYSVPHTADLDMLAGMSGMACIRPRGTHTLDNTPTDCTTGTIFAKGGNYWFQIRQDNSAVEFQHELSGAPGSFVSIAVPGGIPLDTWSYVAFVRRPNAAGDGYAVKLYFNGTLLGAGDIAKLPSSNASALTVGNYGFNGPGDCEFNGDIDEIRLYNTCLSDAQITSIYQDLGRYPVDPSRPRLRSRQDHAEADPGPVVVTPGLQAQPNPFSRSTSVLLRLPPAEQVDVSVFDISGRRVRHLFSGASAANEILVPWDGRNSKGRSVAAGVYIVRMTSPAWTKSIRIVRLN